MVLTESGEVELNWQAVDFKLKATDEKFYTLKDLSKGKPLLIMFICNHCPYVKKIMNRLLRTCEAISNQVSCAAIMPNDTKNYPDDSFVNMKNLAKENNFPFPYLIDETQEVATAYKAVCTPDFYGFDQNLRLQYRGRFDSPENLSKPFGEDQPGELWRAMIEIANNGKCSFPQYPSIGCSIKWYPK